MRHLAVMDLSENQIPVSSELSEYFVFPELLTDFHLVSFLSSFLKINRNVSLFPHGVVSFLQGKPSLLHLVFSKT